MAHADLVFTLGDSPLPVAIAVHNWILQNPSTLPKVHLVTSTKQRGANSTKRLVCWLSVRDIKAELVHVADLDKNTVAAQEAISDLIEPPGQEVVINFTGGTKIMSLAAFKTAICFDIPWEYVSASDGMIYSNQTYRPYQPLSVADWIRLQLGNEFTPISQEGWEEFMDPQTPFFLKPHKNRLLLVFDKPQIEPKYALRRWSLLHQKLGDDFVDVYGIMGTTVSDDLNRIANALKIKLVSTKEQAFKDAQTQASLPVPNEQQLTIDPDVPVYVCLLGDHPMPVVAGYNYLCNNEKVDQFTTVVVTTPAKKEVAKRVMDYLKGKTTNHVHCVLTNFGSKDWEEHLEPLKGVTKIYLNLTGGTKWMSAALLQWQQSRTKPEIDTLLYIDGNWMIQL